MIVLDTHTLLWWVSDKSNLSRKASRVLNAESQKTGGLLVSSISAWEITMLVARSRLKLRLEPGDFIQQLERIDSVQFVPISVEH